MKYCEKLLVELNADAAMIAAALQKADDTGGVALLALDGMFAAFVSMRESTTLESIPAQLRRIADSVEAANKIGKF